MLPPGAIFELKIHQNAPPGGAYSAYLDPNRFSVGRFAAGKGREERYKEKRGGKRGVERSPLLYLQFNHWLGP